MQPGMHVRRIALIASLLLVLIVVTYSNTALAAPPFQSGGPAAVESAQGGSVVGVPVSTSDKLAPLGAVPDPRPFSIGHQSESEYARLKQEAQGKPIALVQGRAAQQDPAVTQSKLLPAAPNPLLNNWQGIGPTAYEPPDPHIAAGPDQIITTVNLTWVIYDKQGNQLYSSTLNSWFGAIVPSGTYFSDPKVVYDQFSNRWILAMIAFKSSTNQAWWLVSVSNQQSAIGGWWNYALDATMNGGTPTTNWADYPGVGVDNQALYLTANMFSFSGNAFQYSKLRILNKSVMYSGGSLGWWDFWNMQNPTGGSAFTVQPAIMYGTPGVEYLINSYSGSGSYLTLWTLSNPLGSPSLTSLALSVPAYSVPPDAEQPGTTWRIATNDARLLNAVYRNYSLWTTHAINYDWGSGNRSILRLYEILPASGTVRDAVGFGATDLYYYFPAVTADAYGNAAVEFSRSGATEYASIRYTGRLSSEFGLQGSAELKGGEADYFGNRWGDFSGMAADPNGRWFWMYNQYAASGGVWKTWVGGATYAPLACSWVDNFSSYATGAPPNGWSQYGSVQIQPVIEEYGGSGAAYRLLSFPQPGGTYLGKRVIKDGTSCGEATLTTKINLQSANDEAGIVVAFKDANNHVDVTVNPFFGEIVVWNWVGGVMGAVAGTGHGGVSVSAGTNYWLRAVTHQNGTVGAYWSTDGLNFTLKVTTGSLGNLNGGAGYTTNGFSPPHVHFDDFNLSGVPPQMYFYLPFTRR